MELNSVKIPLQPTRSHLTKHTNDKQDTQRLCCTGFISETDAPDTATHNKTHPATHQRTTYTMPRFPGFVSGADTPRHCNARCNTQTMYNVHDALISRRGRRLRHCSTHHNTPCNTQTTYNVHNAQICRLRQQGIFQFQPFLLTPLFVGLMRLSRRQ